jgi:hypothetical protein
VKPSRSRAKMRLRRNIMPCAPNRRRRVGAAASTIELSFRQHKPHLLKKASEFHTF